MLKPCFLITSRPFITQPDSILPSVTSPQSNLKTALPSSNKKTQNKKNIWPGFRSPFMGTFRVSTGVEVEDDDWATTPLTPIRPYAVGSGAIRSLGQQE